MLEVFSVNTIFFTILEYPVSYLEFVGTVLYFTSVWLIARRNVLTWPIGIASVILYMMLFYQFNLYSDTIEQVYYLVASAFGWWFWSRGEKGEKVATGFSNVKEISLWAVATVVLGLSLGAAMSSIHIWIPAIFPEPASLPYIDALTTVMSFSAMWLLTLKRAESWIYWILVDIAAVYVYFTKGIMFVGLQYIVLLGIAIYGFISWLPGKKSTSESVR
jgi:nicotinamide mononucleotide transporter